ALPIEAIPPGVDVKRFFPGTPETAAGDDAPFLPKLERLADPGLPPVITIARAEKTKNLFGILEAFASNAYVRGRANLIIATSCDDKMLETLNGRARELGIAGRTVILTGISQTNAQFYRFAARRGGVFVNAAFYEAFGLTLLEAAASGLPVVATRNG